MGRRPRLRLRDQPGALAARRWARAEKLRGVTDNQTALARAGRYKVVSENLHVKEVWVGDGASRRRFILARNLPEAARDGATRTRHLDRLTDELAAIENKSGDGRLAAEGALLAHPVLRRYLTRRKGRLVIDTAAVKSEEKLDGKYLFVHRRQRPRRGRRPLYKGLLEAERSFRDLEGVLELRPVYHRLEQRIRAHITLCYLGLMLIRVAENATNLSWPVIARTMDFVHAGTFTGPAGRVTQRAEATGEQRDILRALHIDEPVILLDHDLSAQVSAPAAPPRQTPTTPPHGVRSDQCPETSTRRPMSCRTPDGDR